MIGCLDDRHLATIGRRREAVPGSQVPHLERARMKLAHPSRLSEGFLGA